jgi:RNA polymerase sigma factor (sigma-70 family)
MIYNMTGNEADSWDLTQEVFLRAWRALPQFEDRAQFYTWLHRIAHNAVCDWLRRQKPVETFSVSLQTLVLAMRSPDADRAILERNVDWLEKAQVSQGPATGSWSYGTNKGTGDNSNAQFALLALHEADKAGVRVRREVWARAQQYWASCANPDGSWGYTIGNAAGSGSMTCPICFAQDVDSVLVPCGHTICATCARSLPQPRCPFDRKQVTALLPFYRPK